MARYTEFTILSLLVGTVAAIPQWQHGAWSPSNWQSDWQHRTIGTPLSRPAQSTSSGTSHVQTTSAQGSTTISLKTSSTTQTSTSHKTFSTMASTTTSKVSITTSYSLTTSRSTSTKQSSSTTSVNPSLTSSSSITPTPTSASGGKRGMAYNDAFYAALFASSSQVTWGYNWYSAANGLPSTYDFVPMLWGSGSGFTNVWATNVANSLAAGTTHLLAFNEPDLDSQSNMSPATAADAFMTYLQPYASEAKLCSPAITNGNSATMGLNWLSSFMEECKDCTIDVITLHWYNNPGTFDDFVNHIETAHSMFPTMPIWITEFGLNSPTSDEAVSFLEEALPWLDQQDYVERYAYFMAAENFLVDSTGSALSEYGSIFAEYTGSSV